MFQTVDETYSRAATSPASSAVNNDVEVIDSENVSSSQNNSSILNISSSQNYSNRGGMFN